MNTSQHAELNTSLHDKMNTHATELNMSLHAAKLTLNQREITSIRRARSFPPNVARMPAKKQAEKAPKKKVIKKEADVPLKVTKLSPDYTSSIYDNLRPSVKSILSVSTKFHLKSSRSKGVVLACGSSDPLAKEEGFATCFVPLKTMEASSSPTLKGAMLVDNPLIVTLAKYAEHKGSAQDMPELILGLCCNNWGMYYGRNALIEALLEVMGPANTHKLSIHSAVYAMDFNVHALSQILPEFDDMDSSERCDRALHIAAFEASAAKYGIGLDLIEKDDHRFAGVSKADLVHELSQAVAQAVERTMANNGKAVTSLVLQILRHRRLIQDNLANKKFRRAPSQNGIAEASRKLSALFQESFGGADFVLAKQLPGWKGYTESLGGAAPALLGLFCHSLDVLAGCVARAQAATGNASGDVAPDLAERLVLTVLDKEQRLLEYCFNQIYELLPACEEDTSRMYLYRRLGDLSQFSTMPCGAVELGGKL